MLLRGHTGYVQIESDNNIKMRILLIKNGDAFSSIAVFYVPYQG